MKQLNQEEVITQMPASLREMRKRIKRQLVASGHGDEEAKKTAGRLLELLKAVAGR